MERINQAEKIFEADDKSRRETALKELKMLVAAYKSAEINSQAGRLMARRLIEHLIFQQGSYRLEKEDWIPYAISMREAANEAVEGYVGEIRAYKERFRELIEAGKSETEAERELREDSQNKKEFIDLTKAESFANLERVLEAGLLDSRSAYLAKRLIAGEVRDEVMNLMRGGAIDVFKQQTAERLAAEYEKLGVLDRQVDVDVFTAIS